MTILKEFKYGLVAIAGLLVLSAFGTFNNYHGKKTTGYDLTNNLTHGETVSFVGEVIDRKGTSASAGLVLTMRTEDGYEVICVVPEDVPMPSYELNDRFQIQASTNGTMLTVLDIKRQKNPKHVQKLNNYIEVRNGWARFQRGRWIAKLQAPGVPDGDYTNLVEVYDDNGFGYLALPEEE